MMLTPTNCGSQALWSSMSSGPNIELEVAFDNVGGPEPEKNLKPSLKG